MHAVEVETEPEPNEIILGLGVLITEGRLPGVTAKGYGEGAHCVPYVQKTLESKHHVCASNNHLCERNENLRKQTGILWDNGVPLCIEVFLCSNCQCAQDKCVSGQLKHRPDPAYVLLEQWTITATKKRRDVSGGIRGKMLMQVVRSFLHFSQLSAWLAVSKGEEPQHILYRVTMPGDDFGSKFSRVPEDHEFPVAAFKNHHVNVKVKSLPRLEKLPQVLCSNPICPVRRVVKHSTLFTDGLLTPTTNVAKRYQSPTKELSSEHIRNFVTRPTPIRVVKRISPECKIRGKHNCTKEPYSSSSRGRGGTRISRKDMFLQSLATRMAVLTKERSEHQGGRDTPSSGHEDNHETNGFISDSSTSDIEVDDELISCTSESERVTVDDDYFTEEENSSTSENHSGKKSSQRAIPTFNETLKFRKYLDSAASMVFHGKTGLPLTSSPAPLRKGLDRFDFDSSLVSPARIKSAITKCRYPPRFSEVSQSLLGSFEESVLKGRIEPVSTVEGFTAEIGASGSFCPDHIQIPVTVFFYSFCNNDKVSMPYMAHLNLGKKGYGVPKKGTVQVTLFNPQHTVIKMFVVMYDLSDMPPESTTFVRQKILYMPLGASESHPDAQKWLRYLIHLRFSTSRSGKIYLHTDLRIIVFRKSDADAAMGHSQAPHELRSFTYTPELPKYSPKISQGPSSSSSGGIVNSHCSSTATNGSYPYTRYGGCSTS